MIKFENLQIQLVDVPPLQLDHIEPGFPNLIRNADLLLLLVDLTEDPIFQMEILLEGLSGMRIKVVGKGSISSLEMGWILCGQSWSGINATLKMRWGLTRDSRTISGIPSPSCLSLLKKE